MALQSYQALIQTPALTREQALIRRSFDLITTAESLQGALQDAERGQRGYLITGDSRYLRAYRNGTEQAPQQLAQLQRLFRADPNQAQSMGPLTQAIQTKLGEMQSTIIAYHTHGLAIAQKIVGTNAGLDSMERIEQLLGTLVTNERARLGRRLSVAAHEHAISADASLASALVVLLLIAIGMD